MFRMLMLGLAATLVAAPAAAQDADPRWTPWLGCWELVTDEERADAPPPAAAAIDRLFGPAGTRRPDDAEGARVCVAPEGAGVRVTTALAGAVVHEQTIVADGREHPVAGECPGTRQAEWSAHGRRLVAHAEIQCAGAPARSGASLTLLTPDGSWLDVEAVRAGSRESLQVRRYRRLDPPAPGAAVTGDPFTIPAVEDASRRLPPAVVEAALVETDAAFGLTGRQAVALADAGLPERIIDLMVALSYPEKFVVERRLPAMGGSVPNLDSGMAPHLRGYYYMPFGYSYADYYTFSDAFFLRDARFTRADEPAVGGGGGGTIVPGTQPYAAPRHAVVNDLGYTRITPRAAEPSTARPRSISTSTAGGGAGGAVVSQSAPGGGSSDAGGGGASASPQGYSGGGGDTGRTAVPR